MNRTVFVIAVALLVPFGIPLPGTAAFAAPQKGKPATPATATPQPVQAEVKIADVFSIQTPYEQWALLDPMPAQDVSFGTQRLAMAERLVNTSTTGDGLTQLLFPVSWFEPYQDKNPEIKYVVVKYRDGKACFIMAEYQPERLSMPKEGFEPHPDGTSFYKDLNVYRKENNVFMKQALTKGQEDGRGGYWVDTMVIYFVERQLPKPQPVPPKAKKG